MPSLLSKKNLFFFKSTDSKTIDESYLVPPCLTLVRSYTHSCYYKGFHHQIVSSAPEKMVMTIEINICFILFAALEIFEETFHLAYHSRHSCGKTFVTVNIT